MRYSGGYGKHAVPALIPLLLIGRLLVVNALPAFNTGNLP